MPTYPDRVARFPPQLLEQTMASVALAERFGQQALLSLSADLNLVWLDSGSVLSVSGRFEADVLQTCVISLEPVSARLDEKINLLFARDPQKSADIIDPEEAEPLIGEVIDLGELVAEELSLALNPYPRRPDIDPSSIDLGPNVTLMGEEDAEEAGEKTHPFVILSSRKPTH